MKTFIYKNLVVNGKVLNQVVDENGVRLGVGETVEEALKDAKIPLNKKSDSLSNLSIQDCFDV